MLPEMCAATKWHTIKLSYITVLTTGVVAAFRILRHQQVDQASNSTLWGVQALSYYTE